MNWIKILFRKKLKISLRDKVVEMYGQKAGELYDKINQGIPIGGFLETAAFLLMVEEARKAMEE